MTSKPRWRRADAQRGDEVTIFVDGAPVVACTGETVATAMLAADANFECGQDGVPRAPLCNMGTCFECVATVDDRLLTRTCLLPVREGITVRTEERL